MGHDGGLLHVRLVPDKHCVRLSRWNFAKANKSVALSTHHDVELPGLPKDDSLVAIIGFSEVECTQLSIPMCILAVLVRRPQTNTKRGKHKRQRVNAICTHENNIQLYGLSGESLVSAAPLGDLMVPVGEDVQVDLKLVDGPRAVCFCRQSQTVWITPRLSDKISHSPPQKIKASFGKDISLEQVQFVGCALMRDCKGLEDHLLLHFSGPSSLSVEDASFVSKKHFWKTVILDPHVSLWGDCGYLPPALDHSVQVVACCAVPFVGPYEQWKFPALLHRCKWESMSKCPTRRLPATLPPSSFVVVGTDHGGLYLYRDNVLQASAVLGAVPREICVIGGLEGGGSTPLSLAVLCADAERTFMLLEVRGNPGMPPHISQKFRGVDGFLCGNFYQEHPEYLQCLLLNECDYSIDSTRKMAHKLHKSALLFRRGSETSYLCHKIQSRDMSLQAMESKKNAQSLRRVQLKCGHSENDENDNDDVAIAAAPKASSLVSSLRTRASKGIDALNHQHAIIEEKVALLDCVVESTLKKSVDSSLSSTMGLYGLSYHKRIPLGLSWEPVCGTQDPPEDTQSSTVKNGDKIVCTDRITVDHCSILGVDLTQGRVILEVSLRSHSDMVLSNAWLTLSPTESSTFECQSSMLPSLTKEIQVSRVFRLDLHMSRSLFCRNTPLHCGVLLIASLDGKMMTLFLSAVVVDVSSWILDMKRPREPELDPTMYIGSDSMLVASDVSDLIASLKANRFGRSSGHDPWDVSLFQRQFGRLNVKWTHPLEGRLLVHELANSVPADVLFLQDVVDEVSLQLLCTFIHSLAEEMRMIQEHGGSSAEKKNGGVEVRNEEEDLYYNFLRQQARADCIAIRVTRQLSGLEIITADSITNK